MRGHDWLSAWTKSSACGRAEREITVAPLKYSVEFESICSKGLFSDSTIIAEKTTMSLSFGVRKQSLYNYHCSAAPPRVAVGAREYYS